jgi:integrase
MLRRSLNDTKVRAAKPQEKQFKLFDERGLFLLVTPTGGKLWRLKYRLHGTEKLLALGQYPDVSLAQARDRRDAARKLIANGLDPVAEKRATREKLRTAAEETFEVIARGWFAKFRPTWTAGHQRTIISRLENNVFPRIGSRAIQIITAVDILDVLQRIEARGANETARRVKQICSQVFTFAISKGLVAVDPTLRLERALSKVESVPQPAVLDPKRIGELLRIFDGYDGTTVVRSALRLAPLVFVRPGELRHAEWTEMDFDRAEWTIAGFKMKGKRSHTVPLSSQAIEILKRLQPITGDSRYVFPSARSTSRPMSDNAILAAYRRCGIPQTELVTHGWRATARSLIAENLDALGLVGTVWESMAEAILEHQLAHVVRDVHGDAYNRTKFIRERRQMMQAWADYLGELKAAPIAAQGAARE